MREEKCQPERQESPPSEDDSFTDIQIRIPEPGSDPELDNMSVEEEPEPETQVDITSPPPSPSVSPDLILINCVNYKQEEENTENLFQKFKESEVGITNDVTESKLFVDIEEEQEKRKERQEVSPKELNNVDNNNLYLEQVEAMAVSPDESFEVVEAEDTSCHSNISDSAPEETGDGVKRSFCCKKHKALFMTSSNSIRC